MEKKLSGFIGFTRPGIYIILFDTLRCIHQGDTMLTPPPQGQSSGTSGPTICRNRTEWLHQTLSTGLSQWWWKWWWGGERGWYHAESLLLIFLFVLYDHTLPPISPHSSHLVCQPEWTWRDGTTRLWTTLWLSSPPLTPIIHQDSREREASMNIQKVKLTQVLNLHHSAFYLATNYSCDFVNLTVSQYSSLLTSKICGHEHAAFHDSCHPHPHSSRRVW